jgi:hypothetical protein
MNNLDVHTSRHLERPLLSPNFASRVGHPNLSISHQDKVLLYGKEHMRRLTLVCERLAEGQAR